MKYTKMKKKCIFLYIWLYVHIHWHFLVLLNCKQNEQTESFPKRQYEMSLCQLVQRLAEMPQMGSSSAAMMVETIFCFTVALDP